MKVYFSRLCLGLAALAVAAGAGAAPASAQDAAWAGGDDNAKAIMQIYKDAKAAGQSEVVVYGGYSAIYKPLWEVFAARFPGITIVPNPLSGPALVTKLDAEFTSGQHGGDILMAGMTELLSNVSKDRAAPYAPPNVKDLPERYVDPQKRFLVQFADVFGVVYNTTKLKDSDVPTKPKDLLDPKHKGFVLDNPLAGGVATLCWIELYHSGLLDAQTMRSLKEHATVVPAMTPYYANLTTGSIPMLAWGSFARQLKLKESGAPVSFRATPGMGVPLYGGTAILKGGPSPLAAKLFQAWFITPEAQAALITKGSSYPLLPGVETPADWPQLKPLVDALKPIPLADYMEVRGRFEATVRDALK